MSKRNNDLFLDFDEAQNSQEYIQENRIEETVSSTPSFPSVSSSMEDKQMLQSLALLEEVQEVIHKTKLAQEETAELVHKLRSNLNGIKYFGEEIRKENSEIKKNLENLNYRMSKKSEEYIVNQFQGMRESFLRDITTGLQRIKKDFLDGLGTDAKTIVSEAEVSLETTKKKIEKSQEGKGIFVTWGMVFYLTILCVSSICFGVYAMGQTLPYLYKEDLVAAKIWYLFCLISPWIWWGVKLFWRKVIDRD